MNVDGIPPELRQRRQWVLWRSETRDGGRKTKVPYVARPPRDRGAGGVQHGWRASSTDPSTWRSFEEAHHVAEGGRFDGVGFVFASTDPFSGVDLDGVISEQGELHPAAQELVNQLGSFAELSPSRTGLHVVVRGKLNGDRHATGDTPWQREWGALPDGRKRELAVYFEARYFTVTGARFAGDAIEECNLDGLLAQFFPNGRTRARTPPRKAAPQPNVDVLARWQRRPGFTALAERPADDQSERDYAIAAFALERGASRDETESLVQAARLARPDDDKPDKPLRPDYLRRTVDSAAEHVEARAAERAGELTDLLGLDRERQVTAVDLYGRGSNAIAYIHLTHGKRIVLDTVGRVASTTKLTAELAIQVGAGPPLKATDVTRVLVLLHDLGRHHQEHEREDQALDHGFTYLRAAPAEPVDMSSQADRWRAFNMLDRIDPVAGARLDCTSVAAASIVLEDGTSGERYVRVGWFKSYVRQQTGPGDAEAITRAMRRVGWRKPGREGRIKATAPDRRGELVWAFFVVPRGWESR